MEPVLFGFAFISFLIASVLHIIYLAFRKEKIKAFAVGITIFGFALQTIALVFRTVISRHAPFVNLYESLVFFSWTTILIYFFLEYRYKLNILGAFVTPLAFLSIGYASVLPRDYKQIEPLVPALQSHWLEIHVIACFLSYGAFAVAFVLGIMYLIKNRYKAGKLPSRLKISAMSVWGCF